MMRESGMRECVCVCVCVCVFVCVCVCVFCVVHSLDYNLLFNAYILLKVLNSLQDEH